MGRFKTNTYTVFNNGRGCENNGCASPNSSDGIWPSTFDKEIVGLELEGVIIQQSNYPLKSPNQVSFIPGSLEAIREIRLKGYKLMVITDQPAISKKQQSQQEFDVIVNYLMQEFGKAGIMSIDGLLYSTSDSKDDIYAKPNDGMFKRAQSEQGITWKNGWFVGSNIKDLKAADKIGSTPVLLKTGNFEETQKKLQTFANKELLSKTKVFGNLLEFAHHLP